MARKKREDGVSGSWLDTYADMVTLLLTFFIMLYSMSTIDAQKYIMLVEAFSKGNNVIVAPEDAPPGDALIDDGSTATTPIEELENDQGLDVLYNILQEYVESQNMTEDVQLTRGEDYVFVRFDSAVTFAAYSHQLNAKGKEILDVLGGGLVRADDYIQEIVIAGHTAEVEEDKSTVDRTLSSNRANAVLLYLQDKNLIDPGKYFAVGYGLYKPIASNDTPEGKAKNRRVEIYINEIGSDKNFSDFIYDAIGTDSDLDMPITEQTDKNEQTGTTGN